MRGEWRGERGGGVGVCWSFIVLYFILCLLFCEPNLVNLTLNAPISLLRKPAVTITGRPAKLRTVERRMETRVSFIKVVFFPIFFFLF